MQALLCVVFSDVKLCAAFSSYSWKCRLHSFWIIGALDFVARVSRRDDAFLSWLDWTGVFDEGEEEEWLLYIGMRKKVMENVAT